MTGDWESCIAELDERRGDRAVGNHARAGWNQWSQTPPPAPRAGPDVNQSALTTCSHDRRARGRRAALPAGRGAHRAEQGFVYAPGWPRWTAWATGRSGVAEVLVGRSGELALIGAFIERAQTGGEALLLFGSRAPGNGLGVPPRFSRVSFLCLRRHQSAGTVPYPAHASQLPQHRTFLVISGTKQVLVRGDHGLEWKDVHPGDDVR